MSFITQNITSAGATIDTLIGFEQYANVRVTSTGTVALAANIVFSSTTIAGQQAQYEIRWEGDFTLGSLAVIIEGFSMNQSMVNQTGTFNCFYDGASWNVQYFADGTDQPQEFYGVNSINAPTSGTITLVSGVDKFYQRISGAPTVLVGNLVVTASTTGVTDGSTFKVEIAGGITIGSNLLRIFGINVGDYFATNGGVLVTAVFDGTANVWRATINSNTAPLASLEIIGDGRVVCNPSASPSAPTTVFLAAEGELLTKRSGLLVADRLNNDNFKPGFFPFTQVTIPVSNAEVLTLFSTGKLIFSAETTPRRCSIPALVMLEVIFGSAAFSGNTTLVIKHDSAVNPLFIQAGGITSTSSNIFMFHPNNASISTSQFVLNDDLVLSCLAGNPSGGAGTVLKIHMFYFTTLLG